MVTTILGNGRALSGAGRDAGYTNFRDASGCKHRCRVGHGENGFVERGNPGDRIDGIESFWGYAKNRLVKYQGMPEEDFYLYLRECEFRFDMRGRDMYRFMLRELRERPLN